MGLKTDIRPANFQDRTRKLEFYLLLSPTGNLILVNMSSPAPTSSSVPSPPIPQGAGSATGPSILPTRCAPKDAGNSVGSFNVSPLDVVSGLDSDHI